MPEDGLAILSFPLACVPNFYHRNARIHWAKNHITAVVRDGMPATGQTGCFGRRGGDGHVSFGCP